MSELWNLWDVKPPPVCSVKTDLHFKGISHLNEVTFNALQTLRDVSHLNKEAAILSRFLYKHRRTFRHDKGMQKLVKVYQCLKRYLKLDMSGTLFTFKQALPHNIKKATIAYLPTKQMLKWVLLRLQAFSQLFVRITELAKETAVYIYRKMCLGWALNLSFLAFSITARMLTTSKYLVAKSIEWYTSFYKSLPYLQETAEFLAGYVFPTDLKIWLGPVDLLPLKKKTFADEIFELIDLANEEDEEKERDEDEDSDNEVKIVKEKFIKSMLKMGDNFSINSDVGEIIVEERKGERKAIKRSKNFQPDEEDLGVPVDDDEGEEVQEVSERPWKKFKNKKEGKRTKWLKKVKKTLKTYDNAGNAGSSPSKRRSNVGSNVSYLTID